MKTLLVPTILLLVLPQLLGADAASARLQQGLFEEEANHNLEAAMTAYQSILTAHEDERKLAATALFRLGECYRKLGRTNEAVAQYQRLLRDFAEQENLSRLSEQNLFALGKAGRLGEGTAASAGLLRPRPSPRERSLIEEQIALTEKQLATTRKMIETGVTSVDSEIPYRQALARLRHQLALLDAPAGGPPQRKWLEEEIALQEKVVLRAKGLIETGLAAVGSEIEPQKELLTLRRELVALESRGNTPASEGGSSPKQEEGVNLPLPKSDLEDVEIRRLETLIKDSPDLINARGPTPLLHQAVSLGRARVARYLLDHGAEVDLPNQNGQAPLHLAAEAGDRAMVALLIERKANVNLRNPSYNNNHTPLMLAAARGYKAVVELLLVGGADVSAENIVGWTALHFAAKGNQREVAEVLLAHKADINARGKSVGTPLHTAATHGEASFASMLLKRGAQVDTPGPMGLTPLVEAIRTGNESLVELLLGHRADPNVRFAITKLATVPRVQGLNHPDRKVDATELTPLMLAAHAGSVSVVQRLIKAGAHVNAIDGQGMTALLWAVRLDQQEVIDILLAAGAEVDRRDKFGWTALTAAAQLGRETMVRSLLDRGANPNPNAVADILTPAQARAIFNAPIDFAPDGYPLHAAVRANSKVIVELLLGRGAELSATDAEGSTALDLAKQSNNADVITLLRKHGANEYVPRTGLITLCRISRSFSQPRFFKGTNEYNRHTLLELIAQVYSEGGARQSPHLAFPDLANIRISRRDPTDGKVRETKVDLDSILGPSGQARDVALEWGDVIEIPELDHRATDAWPGFPRSYANRIDELLTRQIEIRVKGETNRVTLRPPLPVSDATPANTLPPGLGRTTPLLATGAAKTLTDFWLRPVLYGANVLRVSSDLSRVTIKRVDPETKQVRELIWDARVEPRYGANLWLRDGDVIEVPEKP